VVKELLVEGKERRLK